MNIGKLLKIARIEKEWTQEELKNATGIATSTIGMIETGKENPQLKTINTMAKALDYELRIVKKVA